MVISHGHEGLPARADWRERFAIGSAFVGWLLVAGLIVLQYTGHSPSPYGVCYAASGRSVPCQFMRSHR